MNLGLFESFCEMLESLPVKAVFRAADAERKMVEDDLKQKRTEPDENVASVLSFCYFLTSAVRGVYSFIPGLPAEHRVYYRRIIEKLVDAGELPIEFERHFDSLFSAAADQQQHTV